MGSEEDRMYGIHTRILRKSKRDTDSSRPTATKREHCLEVELFLGGISLSGCLVYNARAEQITFMLRKKPSSPPGES